MNNIDCHSALSRGIQKTLENGLSRNVEMIQIKTLLIDRHVKASPLHRVSFVQDEFAQGDSAGNASPSFCAKRSGVAESICEMAK